jgi:hypothetical protein
MKNLENNDGKIMPYLTPSIFSIITASYMKFSAAFYVARHHMEVVGLIVFSQRSR